MASTMALASKTGCGGGARGAVVQATSADAKTAAKGR
jgi:hypothetical protein